MIVHDDILQQTANQVLEAEMPVEVVEQDYVDSSQALVAASDDLGEISRNVETYGAVTESMESFVSRFLDTVPEGEWSRRTAQQYELGMSAILSTVGVSMESSVYMPSMEAAASMTNDENRKATEEKSQGLLKRMYEAFKAMLAKFIESLTGFIEYFKRHSLSVRKMGDSLARRANNTTGATDATDMPAGNWVAYMSQGDKELDPSKAVDTMANLTLAYVKEWTQSFTALAVSISLGKTLGEAFGEGSDSSGVLNNPLKFADIKDETDFPGLNTVVLDGETYGTAKLTVKSSGSVSSEKVKVLSVHEVKDLASALVHLSKQMNSASFDLNDAVKAIKTIESRLKLDVADKLNPGAVAKLLGKVVMANRTLFPLCGEVAKSAYTHGTKSLAFYK